MTESTTDCEGVTGLTTGEGSECLVGDWLSRPFDHIVFNRLDLPSRPKSSFFLFRGLALQVLARRNISECGLGIVDLVVMAVS